MSRIKSYLRILLSLPNLVILLTIVLGTVSSLGLTDNLYPSEKILVGLVTLVAAQMLVDRVGILNSIYSALQQKEEPMTIQLLPRTDPRFERFSDFVKGAKEVMVIGVDLGFLSKADGWFVDQMLSKGVNLKLLLISPNTSNDLRSAVNNQDERNSASIVVHDHPTGANETIESLKSFSSGTSEGKLEIRARIDIPSPSLTIVDPNLDGGKIRVELKLYKRNHGPVPYFILTKRDTWYSTFYEQYYIKLWHDSTVLFKSTEDQKLNVPHN